MIWNVITGLIKAFLIIGGIIFNVYMFIHLGFFWVLVILFVEIKLAYPGNGKSKSKSRTSNSYRK